MKWHIKLMRGGISLSLPPWKGLSLSQVFSSHTIYLERCKIQHQAMNSMRSTKDPHGSMKLLLQRSKNAEALEVTALL